MDIINSRDDLNTLNENDRTDFLRLIWMRTIDRDGNRQNDPLLGYSHEDLDEMFGGAPALVVKTHEQLDAELLSKKHHARTEINRIRNARICAGVEFPSESGVMFDSDDAAQKNVNGAVMMCMLAQSSGAAFEQDWIAQDNRVVTLDAVGIIGLGVAVGHHVGLHKLQANGYKNMIDTATDTAAIQFFVDEYATLA